MFEILSHVLFVIGMLCGCIVIGMIFYLGRSKMKEIDRVVYGYEIPSDSIFFKGFRFMDYGGAFAWRFYARRIGKEWMRERFDKKFQRPFIISFWLIIVGCLFLGIVVIWDELVLHVE